MQASEDPWSYASVYEGRENEMDEQTVTFLLETLEQELVSYLERGTTGDVRNLWGRLQLLARIWRGELLSCFVAKRESRLEQMLTTLACAWVGRGGVSSDAELQNVQLILLKIAGSGLTALVNAALAHPDETTRMSGLAWAPVRPDEETRYRLRELANTPQQHSGVPVASQQRIATQLLIGRGESELMLGTIEQQGINGAREVIHWRPRSHLLSDEQVNGARTELESTLTQKRITALLVLGLADRQECIPRIREILQQEPTESDTATTAIFALMVLQDRDAETVRLLTTRLYQATQPQWIVNALWRLGTPEAVDVLDAYIGTRNDQELMPDEIGLKLALKLASLPERRQAMARRIWPLIKTFEVRFWPNKCFTLVGVIDDPEVHEWLREHAVEVDGGVHYVGRRAAVIKGLARFDPILAFEAACLVLQRQRGDVEEMPELLCALDSPKAIPLLCDHICRERRTTLRWAIGRALRWTPHRDHVLTQLHEMLCAPDFLRRWAGAELCGWIADDTTLQEHVMQLAYNDPSKRVTKAAHNALQRHRHEHAVRDLMERFYVANASEQWSIVTAIVELGDPFLLQHAADPLWIGRLFDGGNVVLATYAERRVEKRKHRGSLHKGTQSFTE